MRPSSNIVTCFMPLLNSILYMQTPSSRANKARARQCDGSSRERMRSNRYVFPVSHPVSGNRSTIHPSPTFLDVCSWYARSLTVPWISELRQETERRVWAVYHGVVHGEHPERARGYALVRVILSITTDKLHPKTSRLYLHRASYTRHVTLGDVLAAVSPLACSCSFV